MIRLYFAILNKGWLRREVMFKVIPKMNHTKGVNLVWENPDKSVGHPICSNRAKIVRRFLAYRPKCDFLMMMDDDIIPHHNPAELVYADKDIIGSPAKVRQVGQALNWVAYVQSPDDPDGYFPVDFSLVDSSIDLLKVDIVGTGCILIRRNVLEQLDAPFLVDFDKYGECISGTDFAFCRKAGKAGFEIYTTPQRVCEHIKQMGFLNKDGYDDSDNRDSAPGRYDIPWGDFAIIQKDWAFIKDIIEKNGVKKVLEFGAGLSSLLMSEIAKVTTYETDRKWSKDIKGRMNGNALSIRNWDGKEIKAGLLQFDLAFVDGPLGKLNGGPGREHSIEYASVLSDRVIVHDAGREDEMRWQNKYLRPDFKMIAKNGNHQSRCQYWERR